jgi:hypothetical protein
MGFWECVVVAMDEDMKSQRRSCTIKGKLQEADTTIEQWKDNRINFIEIFIPTKFDGTAPLQSMIAIAISIPNAPMRIR